MFKHIVPVLLAGFVTSTAHAATESGEKPLTVQQEKMRACNAEAKEAAMKGDERKAFMKECLKGDGAATTAKAKAGKAPVSTTGASSP